LNSRNIAIMNGNNARLNLIIDKKRAGAMMFLK